VIYLLPQRDKPDARVDYALTFGAIWFAQLILFEVFNWRFAGGLFNPFNFAGLQQRLLWIFTLLEAALAGFLFYYEKRGKQ
jgi:hypothetical protein